MHKLFLSTLALCAATGIVFARSPLADNMAGFQRVTITNTHTLITVKYPNVGGYPMALQRLIPGTQAGLNCGEGMEDSDSLIFMRGLNGTDQGGEFYLSNGKLDGKAMPGMQSKTWVRFGDLKPSQDTFTNDVSFCLVSRTATNTPVVLTFAGLYQVTHQSAILTVDGAINRSKEFDLP